MTKRAPTFFPSRLSQYVPNMKYAADVIHSAPYKMSYGALAALNATGILNAQSIAAAVDTGVFASTFSRSVMGPWGRNITVVASGTATSNVTVYGSDYLGQLMSESFALNGATPVQGKKAFANVYRVTAGVTAATTINVGWGNVLGLQYKGTVMMYEFKNGAIAANAGTFIAGVNVTQTSTTGDPRGTYLPVTVIPDGTNTFDLVLMLDDTNLHGNAQA